MTEFVSEVKAIPYNEDRIFNLLSDLSNLEKVRDRIRAQLRTVLQLDVEVTLVSPNTLKRFEGKAKRVTDLR